jgi:type I restriction enzyme S subunit
MSSDHALLAEIADVIDSSHQTPTYVERGVPMVRVTDVKYGALNLRSARHVSEDTFRDYSRRYKPKARDIIISRVGSYGNTAWVVETEFCLGQNVASISPKTIDARYLFFALNSNQIWSQIEGKVVGSTQKTLSLKAIRELMVPRFGKTEESLIGALLGALDDRITLLRETNATLEAIAQAIFKSWFVDFDPVRAKQGGRAPEGMDEATAALFPDSFEESGLGLVPKGWKISPISDAITFSDGKTWRKEDRVESSDVPVFGANGRVGFSRKPNGEGRVIFIGKIGSCGAMNSACGLWWVTNNAFAVSKKSNPTLEWARHVVCGVDFSAYIGGSSNPYMPIKNFGHHRIIVPPEELRIVFEGNAGTLRDSIEINEVVANSLATLRDTLLPRLISGQLRLPEAYLLEVCQ